MRTEIIFLILILPMHLALAQVNKGTIYLAGNTELRKLENSHPQNQRSNIHLALQGGYAVKDNLILGISAGFYDHMNTSLDRPYFNRILETGRHMGIFSRYHLPLSNRTGIVWHLAANRSISSIDRSFEDEDNQVSNPSNNRLMMHELAIRPGFYWFVNRHTMLTTYFGTIAFTHARNRSTFQYVNRIDEYETKVNHFGIGLNPSTFNIALSFYLNHQHPFEQTIGPEGRRKNMIGGNLMLSLLNEDQVVRSYLDFQPRYARFITQNIAVGASFSVMTRLFRYDSRRLVQAAQDNSTYFAYAPFLRYYHFYDSRTALFLHAEYSRGKTHSKFMNHYPVNNIALKGGINYDITSRWSLELVMNLVSYRSVKVFDSSPNRTLVASFDRGNSIGLNYLF